MVRKVIKRITEGFDSAIMDATVRFRFREQNLARFGELVYMDIQNLLAEMMESDSRISIEERNRGYFISFKGHVLFRAAVNVFTDRAEVVVDDEVVVGYLGNYDSELNNYGPRHKVSLAIKVAILSAFHDALGEFLAKEINKL